MGDYRAHFQTLFSQTFIVINIDTNYPVNWGVVPVSMARRYVFKLRRGNRDNVIFISTI